MASKVLRFIEGEHGFNHKFNAKNEDGTAASLTSFTGARLLIMDGSTSKLDITSNLTINTNDVTWAVQSGQTDYNGRFLAVLHLTSSGVLEKTFQFDVIATPKLI